LRARCIWEGETTNIHSNMSVFMYEQHSLVSPPPIHTHTMLHMCYVCYSLSLTTEEEHVKCLVGLQDDKIWPKHHPGGLVLIVVHLNCTVAGATIRHHRCLVTFLRGHKLCDRKQANPHMYSCRAIVVYMKVRTLLQVRLSTSPWNNYGILDFNVLAIREDATKGPNL